MVQIGSAAFSEGTTREKLESRFARIDGDGYWLGSHRLPKGRLAVGRDVFASADCRGMRGLFRSIASVAGCLLRIVRFGREAVLGQRD